MILVDTSAWVEFLRDTGSPTCEAVDGLLASTELAITDVISMEVLAGAKDDRHLDDLRGLLARAVVLPTTPRHYDDAAGLYRTCRRAGVTVRKLVDCLIASVAIDANAELLHADSDFDGLAAHTGLAVHAVR